MYSWWRKCLNNFENRGEGVFLNVDVEKDVAYKLSYAILGDIPPGQSTEFKRNWVLTNGLINRSAPGNECLLNEKLPDLPEGSVILSDPTINPTQWTLNEEIFTADDNFNQLWFRIELVQDVPDPSYQIVTRLDSFNLCALPDIQFNFEDELGNEKDVFCSDEIIKLNGEASKREEEYLIKIRFRPAGSDDPFIGEISLGWISGEITQINLSQLYNSTLLNLSCTLSISYNFFIYLKC